MADPVSIAGLALAIVPLLISALENYEVAFQPFLIYRRHIKEVQRFTTRLETQRAIFRNECQLLFMAISNGQSLSDVLNDHNHPARSDEIFSKRLEELLGSSYNTCLSTLTLINDTLDKITLETKDFRYLVENKKVNGKSTFSRFRQKIKICFSKSRLDEIIDELRRCNEDLVTMARQIRDLATERTLQPPAIAIMSRFISRFQTTQQASIRLYEVLAIKWPCDDQIQHIASMSLAEEDWEQHRNEASKVRFDLALICTSQLAHRQSNPLWLNIESAPSDSSTLQTSQATVPDSSVTALQDALKKMGSISKTVRFDIQEPTAPPDIATIMDLGTMEKLCQLFHGQLAEPVAEQPCVGFLEKANAFKHFLYPSQSPSMSSGAANSLKQILQTLADQGQQEEWVKKLTLARLLVLSVLRFQATPWMPESWSSDDIYFYNDHSLSSPYLNIQLSNTPPNLDTYPTFTASSIAANSTLFSLGVVLLELGYDAPLQTLRREQDGKGGSNNQLTDFFTAQRLGKLVSKQLNATYGKLVEKCLNCNFGVGTELGSAELQSAVMIGVVNELDKCLKVHNDFELFLRDTA